MMSASTERVCFEKKSCKLYFSHVDACSMIGPGESAISCDNVAPRQVYGNVLVTW